MALQDVMKRVKSAVKEYKEALQSQKAYEKLSKGKNITLVEESLMETHKHRPHMLFDDPETMKGL